MNNRRYLVVGLIVGILILTFLLSKIFSGGHKTTNSINRSSSAILKTAADLTDKGDLLAARNSYKQAFMQTSSVEDLEKIKSAIEDLNMKILFSHIIDEKSSLYKVKPGDTLGKIAKAHFTTVELVKKINGLTSDIIKVNDELKVPNFNFSIVVDRKQNKLFLKDNEEVFKTYLVSTGKDNATPLGTFKIINKLVDPVWYNKDVGAAIPADSPDNYLGPRWMGFDIKGYGIHGTIDPQSIGQSVTQGCVRMNNEDVKELYDLIPTQTEVVIVE